MGTGYTRNDTPNNIADGNVINASDLDGEFDAIQAAFNNSTGHSHDGTTGEGPQIDTGGIADSAVTTAKINNDAVTLGTKTSGNYVATIATSAGLDGSASSEGATPTISLNLNELTTSTTDGDGDYFVVVDTAGTQRKLTKANIAVSGFNTANGIALGTDTTGNYIATGAVSGVGLSGSASAEGATFTVTSNATDANTGSTIVARDASGDFSAGTITAALTGNADTATALETARTIAGNSFDGTANITIASTDLSDSGSIDAATLDSLDSTQFLRSDAADTKTSGDLSFSDNVKAIFGAGSDLQIYHDTTANHSYIQESGSGDLIIQGNNVRLENTSGNYYVRTFSGGAVQLYHNNSEKLATTSTGIDVTGNATFDDNGKAIFGAGSDLQIYHDGTHSYVQDAGTGDLRISGNNVNIMNGAATENYIVCTNNGSVAVKYDNATKLETTSTGVDVTGTVTADGLTVDTTGVVYSGGNVGIGTAAPASYYADELVVSAPTEGGITIASTATTNTAYMAFADGTTGDARYRGYVQYNHNTDSMQFGTSGSEAMRIDSSGNVLVGKTSEDATTVGSTMRPNGGIVSVRDGDTNVVLNRKTSDGTIIDLRKDNTTVGSIGSVTAGLEVNSTSALVLESNKASTERKIEFGNDYFGPDSGDDNAIDLGRSGARFNDVFLGGGAYIGGTGSANYLDDYEEGTWTATLGGTTTNPSTAVTVTGTYIKIGRLVWADALFSNVNTSGASGGVQVTGFPYNSDRTNPNGNVMAHTLFDTQATASASNITPFFASGSAVQFYQTFDGGGWAAVTHFGSGAGRYLYFSLTYTTA